MTLAERAARLSQADIIALLQRQAALEVGNAELQRQNEWFKRQLFGRKSERRLLMPDAHQLPLAGILPAREDAADKPPPPTETVHRPAGESGPPGSRRARVSEPIASWRGLCKVSSVGGVLPPPQGLPRAQTCRRYPFAGELGYNPVANAR